MGHIKDLQWLVEPGSANEMESITLQTSSSAAAAGRHLSMQYGEATVVLPTGDIRRWVNGACLSGSAARKHK